MPLKSDRFRSQDGSSEMFIGEWMEVRGIREQIVVATKVGYLSQAAAGNFKSLLTLLMTSTPPIIGAAIMSPKRRISSELVSSHCTTPSRRH